MTDHPTTEEARHPEDEYDALWARLIEHAPSPLVTKYRDAVERRLLKQLNDEYACFDHAHDAALPAQEPLDVERLADRGVLEQACIAVVGPWFDESSERGRFVPKELAKRILREYDARLRDEEERP